MKFYITTPIYYVNDKPHIGHAYTTIAADVLARYHRLLGKEVFFLTGTDEHAQKNVEAAAKVGQSDVKKYVDQMSAVWRETWTAMGLTIDRFIRTTEADHKKGVEQFWQLSKASGDIYEGEYHGLYCIGCEEYKKEDDLVDCKCPLHNRLPEELAEKNYFFRLTKYRQAILDHIDANPEFIQPTSRRNEVRSYVDKFMSDISISRETVKWGIAVPGDESQRIYVWFDALINYLTGVGYGTDAVQFEKYWPADLQLVGKDIIKFHCALWPAMLMSAGLTLPKTVFAHGFFTIDGAKISKSLGNAIDPVELANDFGMDAMRYFLMREISFGEDGDFSRARLEQRYDGELANELGNLVNRVLTMAQKYGYATQPVINKPADDFSDAYRQAMEEIRLHDALNEVMKLVREANQLIEAKAPWKLAKEGKNDQLNATLKTLLEMITRVGSMLAPFMPTTSERIAAQLQSMQPEPLFPRRELTPL